MKSLTICLIILALTTTATAETFEYELQGLPATLTHGTSANPPLTTTVDLTAYTGAVLGISVRLTGTATDGVVRCCEFLPCSERPMPVQIQLSIEDDCPAGTWWDATFELEEGAFDETVIYEDRGPGTCDWLFLGDGPVDFDLRAVTYFFTPWCFAAAPFVVDVDQGTLFVEVDTALPLAPTTWGTIKALYR